MTEAVNAAPEGLICVCVFPPRLQIFSAVSKRQIFPEWERCVAEQTLCWKHQGKERAQGEKHSQNLGKPRENMSLCLQECILPYTQIVLSINVNDIQLDIKSAGVLDTASLCSQFHLWGNEIWVPSSAQKDTNCLRFWEPLPYVFQTTTFFTVFLEAIASSVVLNLSRLVLFQKRLQTTNSSIYWIHDCPILHGRVIKCEVHNSAPHSTVWRLALLPLNCFLNPCPSQYMWNYSNYTVWKSPWWHAG